MKFVKQHKLLTALIGIIIIVIVCGIALIALLISGGGTNTYGNRLDGIDKVKISSSTVKEMESTLESLDSVTKVTYHLKGKLVNIIFTVNDTLALDVAKTYATKALESFDDDQKEYYDFQIFIESDVDASTTYPVIGYKNKLNKEIIWKK